MTNKPTTYVCLGNPHAHLQELERDSAAGNAVTWTIKATAEPGDRVAFYMISPVASFVALGRVDGVPRLEANKRSEWYGHHMARIVDIRLVKPRLHISAARKTFPAWGWLRQPRQSTAVPDTIASEFHRVLASSRTETVFASDSDIEGIAKELVRVIKSRSRKLRGKALHASRGICCVCERDFSQVLGGQGVRVLQVHHCKQLAGRPRPSRTSLNDLAVVCANCHMLLHLESGSPLSIAALRQMLIDDGQL